MRSEKVYESQNWLDASILHLIKFLHYYPRSRPLMSAPAGSRGLGTADFPEKSKLILMSINGMLSPKKFLPFLSPSIPKKLSSGNEGDVPPELMVSADGWIAYF